MTQLKSSVNWSPVEITGKRNASMMNCQMSKKREIDDRSEAGGLHECTWRKQNINEKVEQTIAIPPRAGLLIWAILRPMVTCCTRDLLAIWVPIDRKPLLHPQYIYTSWSRLSAEQSSASNGGHKICSLHDHQMYTQAFSSTPRIGLRRLGQRASERLGECAAVQRLSRHRLPPASGGRATVPPSTSNDLDDWILKRLVSSIFSAERNSGDIRLSGCKGMLLSTEHCIAHRLIFHGLNTDISTLYIYIYICVCVCARALV